MTAIDPLPPTDIPSDFYSHTPSIACLPPSDFYLFALISSRIDLAIYISGNFAYL